MKKKYIKIKLTLKSKNIKSTNLSTTLGPKGINIKEFINKFNKKTEKYKKNTILPTIIKIYKNKKYKLKIKKPTVTYLIKEIIKNKKNNKNCLNKKEIMKIIKIKKKDLNSIKEEKNIKTILGSLKSMGINKCLEKKI
ncbi:MAG: 50S ribosomal protein L11 [Candidatus Vidania fulgoroideorum]